MRHLGLLTIALVVLTAACATTGNAGSTATTVASTSTTTTAPADTTTSTAALPTTTTQPATATTTITSSTAPPPAFVSPPGDNVRAWVEGGALFVQAREDDTVAVYRSVDGATWTPAPTAVVPDPAGEPLALDFRGEMVEYRTIAVGDCGVGTRIWITAPGAERTRVDSGPLRDGGVAAVAAQPDQQLAVAWFASSNTEECVDAAGAVTVFLSDNGRSYRQAETPPESFQLGHLGSIDDLIWASGGYVLAGSDVNETAFWSSPDGESWLRTRAPWPSSAYAIDLAEWNGRIYAAGDDQNSGALVLWSTDDQLEWAAHPAPPLTWSSNLSVWDGGLAIIDMTSEVPTVWVSRDAETWVPLA